MCAAFVAITVSSVIRDCTDMQKFKKHAQAAVINGGLQDRLKIPKKLGGLDTDGDPSVE